MNNSDAIFVEVNGELMADNVALDVWTDAAKKRHVAGENVLAQCADPEFKHEAGAVVVVRVARGSTGHGVQFEGIVSRVGMRGAVNEDVRHTFQIDEQ